MSKLIIICLFIFSSMCIAQEKYVLPCNKSLLEMSNKIARQQIGVKEATGRNDGKQVEAYLKSVGRGRGSAYCAAGVYYCFFEACKNLKMNLSNIPIARTGLANGIFADAKKKGKLVPFKIKKHDLLVWRKGSTIFGHIERVDSVLSKGIVRTIGFNTSNGKKGKQEEGDGVFERLRNPYHPLSRTLLMRGAVGFE